MAYFTIVLEHTGKQPKLVQFLSKATTGNSDHHSFLKAVPEVKATDKSSLMHTALLGEKHHSTSGSQLSVNYSGWE